MQVGDLVIVPTGLLGMVIDTTCVQAKLLWLTGDRFGTEGWMYLRALKLVG
jgi:hypothetical protein